MTERIELGSSWLDPPTDQNIRRIYWYAKVLNRDLTEADMPTNKLEARNTIYQLRADLKRKNRERRQK